ncbi:MAG: peptidase and in kexin sedolisin [Lacrimispora sp.]|nr:peptidase and in kexin sedolisin [Lacrimispora sp.]
MEKILDNNYYDLIINNVSGPLYDEGDNITPLNIRHSLLSVPVRNADPCDLGKHPYYNFPSLYTATSTVSIEKSGMGTVQRNPWYRCRNRPCNRRLSHDFGMGNSRRKLYLPFRQCNQQSDHPWDTEGIFYYLSQQYLGLWNVGYQ